MPAGHNLKIIELISYTWLFFERLLF